MNKDKSFILSGLHYGEHGIVPEEIFKEIETYSSGGNLVMIRPTPNSPRLSDELYLEIADYCKKNKMYLCTLYGLSSETDKGGAHFTPELVKKLYDYMGEYYLGDFLGEVGSSYGTKPLNHGVDEWRIQEGLKDMREASDHYISVVKNLTNKEKEYGMKTTWNVESTTLSRYNLHAGVDVICVELMLGNPEHIIAFGRGATRAFDKDFFGTYVAHEWYGGMHQKDPLKAKRLSLVYNEAYISGSNMLLLESGFKDIIPFGEKLDKDHPIVVQVRDDLATFNKWIKEDKRPARGPITKVAFISGNLCGYGGHSWAYGGISSSVWAQHDREEWGYGSAERSFNILDEVYCSADWHNTVNYGDNDYSTAPAYGQYDVLPAEATLEAMKRYDWLIFTGWNTMTDEIYNNIKEYVKAGGNVLISPAHLNTTANRGDEGSYIKDDKMSEFLGCEFTGDIIRTNNGFKFESTSTIKGMIYPGVPDHVCDTTGDFGYTDYLDVKLTTGRKAAFLSDNFRQPDYETTKPVLIENQFGKGNVLFMTSKDYPGADGVYPLYKNVVKMILAATHRLCDVKVIGNDKVRFSVFEDDSIYKVYLLNTDMNVKQSVFVTYKGEKIEKTIPSLGIDFVIFNK